MTEIMLDSIQCHYCGERFEPDEASESDHWKVCEKSPETQLWRLQKELGQLICNHENLIFISPTSTELYMCASCNRLFNWCDPENQNHKGPKNKPMTPDELISFLAIERENARTQLMKAIKAVNL